LHALAERLGHLLFHLTGAIYLAGVLADFRLLQKKASIGKSQVAAVL
jgi:hypothetical protein